MQETKSEVKMKLSRKEVICNCNEVTRGEINDAIRKHQAYTLAHIQQLCGAGVRCGRCIPIIDEILLQQGKRPNLKDGQLSIEF